MKRILISLAVAFFLVIIALYIIVPSELKINRIIAINSSVNGANRALNDKSKWLLWWPGTTQNGFTFNKIKYTPTIPAVNSYNILLRSENDSLNSTIFIAATEKDSVSFLWSSTITTSKNPLKRFNQYVAAHNYAEQMDSVLEHMKNFLEKTENIYNIRITRAIVKDTLLLSIKKTIDHEPSTEDIYALITKLNTAIKTDGAEATNYPMLNVTDGDSNHFIMQVAVPVNNAIKEENDMIIKRMVPGNILITDNIQGGKYAIKNAFNEIQNYMLDHQDMAPAISFQSLITNRMEQPDTSKWITKIYYPIY